MNKTIFNTFKQGSKTYFYSSIFFSKAIRRDVFSLYGFVRKADDFVDVQPQKREEFYRFWDAYHEALNGKRSEDIIIDSFVQLKQRKAFEDAWIDAFFQSMEMDMNKKRYQSIEETLEYMYGSAEVIGLMMAKILDLDPRSHPFARCLGRAMQYINFIRDIQEDLILGRTYLPLEGSSLQSLEQAYVLARKDRFINFVRSQIDLYLQWQGQAEKGFSFIPKRFLIPIKTASDMYRWTAGRIYRNPMLVYQGKIKPTIPRILLQITRNSFMGGKQQSARFGAGSHA